MRDRGQALIEAVVAMPVFIMASLALVDCGLMVRNQLAVTGAATRAAQAVVLNKDSVAAAKSGMPAVLKDAVYVVQKNDRLVVKAKNKPRILGFVGAIEYRSEAVVGAEVVR